MRKRLIFRLLPLCAACIGGIEKDPVQLDYTKKTISNVAQTIEVETDVKNVY